LKRALLDHLRALEKSTFCEAFHLTDPHPLPALDGFFRSVYPNLAEVQVSVEMNSPKGLMHKHDLLLVQSRGESKFVFALAFGAGKSLCSGLPFVFALVRKCVQTAPGIWSPLEEVLTVRSCDLIEAVPYCKVGDGVHPLHLVEASPL